MTYWLSLLASLGLIDEYTFVIAPIVLGAGRTLFQGVDQRLALRQTSTRSFRNGNLVVSYQAVK